MAGVGPRAYRAWFSTPMGRQVEADEKAEVLRLAALSPGERVLDLGCGDGTYTSEAGRVGHAVGLDLSTPMLRAAAERIDTTTAHLVQGDAARLPFRDGVFDVVLAVTLLCFVREPLAVVHEAHRVLRPGGRLVLAELGRYSMWALKRRLTGLLSGSVWREARFFSFGGLTGLMRDGGFEVDARAGAVFYPPVGAIAASKVARLVERTGRRFLPGAGALLVVSARAA